MGAARRAGARGAAAARLRRLAVCAALAAAAPASAADAWWAYDKGEHLLVTTAIASVGTTAPLPWVSSRWARLGIGFGLAVLAGAAKETLDLAGLGDPSWKDFSWDVIGAAAGALIAAGVEWIAEKLGVLDGPPRRASALTLR